MIDESNEKCIEDNLAIVCLQEKMSLLETYHDASEIIMQKHLARSKSIRELCLKLEEEKKLLYSINQNMSDQIQQLKNQLSQIQVQKLKPCQKYFITLWEYSNKNSFRKIIEEFINKFSQDSKQAVQSLTTFTNNYLSKNIHRQVQNTINLLLKDLQKREILYKPRINTILNRLIQQQQQLSNLNNKLQHTTKEILNLRIDEQILENQYRIAIQNHEARLQQAENYIRVQAKILNLQYVETMHTNQSNNLVEATADFQVLLLKQFMQRLNQYTECSIKLEQLTQKINREKSLFKESVLIQEKNNGNYNNTSIMYQYRQNESNTQKASKLNTKRMINFGIQNQNKLVNIDSNQIGKKKYVLVYKKTIIGHDPNLIQDRNFQSKHLRELILKDKYIGFAKDYLKEKVDIRNIHKIQVKTHHLLINLKKNFILLKPYDCTLLEILALIQANFPAVIIDRK